MTEAEWLAEQKRSQWMVSTLLRPGKVQRTKAGKRKLRLFACGCCRMVWHLLDKTLLRPAVQAAEQFADGAADEDELRRRSKTVEPLSPAPFLPKFPGLKRWTAARMVADACESKAGDAALGQTIMPMALAGHSIGPFDGEALLCHLLRDIFGNPFRPASVKREWIAANDRTAEGVAMSIYEDRAFDRLPILADALEDAGCNDEAILGHCRGPGPHVRGCWVVDLILGRQ